MTRTRKDLGNPAVRRILTPAILLLLLVACGCSPTLDRIALDVTTSAGPPSDLVRIAGLQSRLQRKFYPYSVVYGGVHSAVELSEAADGDPLVKEHYSEIRRDRVRLVKLTHDRRAYVSYRTPTDGVYWTSKPVTLRAGEELLTDGENIVRARCGNRVSDAPRTPVMREPLKTEKDSPMEPAAASFEIAFPAEAIASKPQELYDLTDLGPPGKGEIAPQMALPIRGGFGQEGLTVINPGGGGLGGAAAPGGGGGGSPPSGSGSGSGTGGNGTPVYGTNYGFTPIYVPVLTSPPAAATTILPIVSYPSGGGISTSAAAAISTTTVNLTPPPVQILVSWAPPSIPAGPPPPYIVCGLPPHATPPTGGPPITVPNPPGSPGDTPGPHGPSGNPLPPGGGPPPGSPPNGSGTPEPAGILLVGVGLVASAAWLRFRRSRLR